MNKNNIYQNIYTKCIKDYFHVYYLAYRQDDFTLKYKKELQRI